MLNERELALDEEELAKRKQRSEDMSKLVDANIPLAETSAKVLLVLTSQLLTRSNVERKLTWRNRVVVEHREANAAGSDLNMSEKKL
jgi:hypothetical protein